MTEASEHPPFLLTTSGSLRIVDTVHANLASRKFPAARESLKQLWKRNDGQIATAFYRADIALSEAIDSGLEDDYDQFFEESSEFRRLIRKAPMSTGIDYMRGESERQLYVAHAARGENIRAAFALRTSLIILEDLQERHPGYVELYGSLGFLHVTLSTLPKELQQLFAAFGLTSTVEQGISELEMASSSSRFAASGASETIAILSRHEATHASELAEAVTSIRDTQRDLPMVGLILGDVLIRSRRSRMTARPVMPVLPGQHQRLSGNFSVDFPAFYSSGG